YVLVTESVNLHLLDRSSLLLLIILGVIHTGFAYLLYFSVLKNLQGYTIAILSYIDPISAVIMASIFLHEKMTPLQIIGGLFILGSTLLNERKQKQEQIA